MFPHTIAGKIRMGTAMLHHAGRFEQHRWRDRMLPIKSYLPFSAVSAVAAWQIGLHSRESRPPGNGPVKTSGNRLDDPHGK
jgi:hypothetical protein